MVVVDLEASDSLDCGGRDVPGEAVLDSRVAVEPSPLTGVGDESPKHVHRVSEGVGLDARSGQRDGFGVVPGVLLPGVVAKAEYGNQGVSWRPVGEARDERCGVVRFATVLKKKKKNARASVVRVVSRRARRSSRVWTSSPWASVRAEAHAGSIGVPWSIRRVWSGLTRPADRRASIE